MISEAVLRKITQQFLAEKGLKVIEDVDSFEISNYQNLKNSYIKIRKDDQLNGG